MSTDPSPLPPGAGDPGLAANGVVGLLLAGGRARRMGGGDKCRQRLAGRTLLDHVMGRVSPQVAHLVLNANGDVGRFADTGLPVIADPVGDFAGPLAGILAGLDWARRHTPDCPWVVSIATDTPFLPTDLVARLLAGVEAEGADLACAASAGRIHPVFGLWPVRHAPALRSVLIDDGIRRVGDWMRRHRVAIVDFPASGGDPFYNINAPEHLATAELMAAGVAPSTEHAQMPTWLPRTAGLSIGPRSLA